jgi:hypothetical protein
VSVNGTLVEDKTRIDSSVNVHSLASTSVPFALRTMQVPNLALTHTKLITMYQRTVQCTYTWPTKSLALGLCGRALDPSRHPPDLYGRHIFDFMRRALVMNKGGRGHSLDLCGKTFDLNRGTCT